jgi:peptide/nickel transport system substrate-binding protein
MPADQGLQNITYDTTALKTAIASKSSADKQIVIGYDSSSPDNQLAANLMQATFATLGLTAKVQSYPTSQIFGWISNIKGAPNLLVTSGWPDAPPPYTWGHISWDAGAGLNYFNCSDPATSADLAAGLKSGADADFTKAAADVIKTGCFLNLTNIDDFMVAQPWLKGVSESHIVSDPNSLYLATLSE